jgi:hypothetical protein
MQSQSQSQPESVGVLGRFASSATAEWIVWVTHLPACSLEQG